MALVLVICGLSAVGCTCCRHRALYDSLGTDGGPGALRRNDVYTFVVGGTDLLDRGPDRLAAGLNELGFAKVYTGTRFHANWFAKEAKRLLAENPDARFAIVGRRSGALRASELALQFSLEGLPLDVLILLDPDGLTAAEYSVGSVEPTIIHSTEAGLEAAPISSILTSVAAHIPNVESVPVVLPLVDDPPPAPEVVSLPQSTSAISR